VEIILLGFWDSLPQCKFAKVFLLSFETLLNHYQNLRQTLNGRVTCLAWVGWFGIWCVSVG